MRNGSLRISRNLNKKIEKYMDQKAEEISAKARREIRDELQKTLREEIYASFAPVQISGKKTEAYNKNHKHQRARPYHHTGLLISHTFAKIDGEKIKIVVEGEYPDGTPILKVYNWLKNGTSESENDVYILGGKGSHTPYVGYEPTPPHKFEQRTLDRMDVYLKQLVEDINRNPAKYGV